MSQSTERRKLWHKKWWFFAILAVITCNVVLSCGNNENSKAQNVEIEGPPIQEEAIEGRPIQEEAIEGPPIQEEAIESWYSGNRYRQGGIVVFEKNGAGLVVAPIEIKAMSWYRAIDFADTLELNGYDDWRLPCLDEFEIIYQNIGKLRTIDDQSGYWSIETMGDDAFEFDLYSGGGGRSSWEFKKYNGNYVMLVRNFGGFKTECGLVTGSASAE